jgi:hypothetical protein
LRIKAAIPPSDSQKCFSVAADDGLLKKYFPDLVFRWFWFIIRSENSPDNLW